MKILIVDDDESARVYLERLLKNKGYEVESAINGTMAMDKINKSLPDIIISDILMPEMDGFEFCRWIKSNERFKHIPFIFYTAAYTEKLDEELAMSIGASKFILKPVEIDTFSRIIEEVIILNKEKKLAIPDKILIKHEEYEEKYSRILVKKLEKKIKDLEQTKEALKISEELYRIFINSSSDIVFLKDENLRHLLINQAYEKFLCKTENEIIGKTDFELLSKEIAQNCIESDLKALGSEKVIESEETVADAVYETRKFRVKLKNGKFGVGGYIRNITIRKKVEDELIKSKKFIETVFDSINMLVSVIDIHNHKIVKVNKALINASNLKEEEIIGKKCYEVIHNSNEPCNSPEHKCPLLETLKTGNFTSVEHIHYDQDGNKIPFSVSTFPIKNEKCEIYQVVHIAHDITKDKQAKEMLESSEIRFRGTFEQAAVGIAHVATDGKFILVNNKLCDIIGYKREELLEKKFQDITHPDDIGTDLEYDKQMLEDKIKTFSLEKRYIRKDASIIWVNLTVSFVRDSSNAQKYFISVIEDITNRKIIEEQLKNSFEKINKTFNQTVSALSLTSENRDPYTTGHQKRVARLACAIAKTMNFSEDSIKEIQIAGNLHDIGKINLPIEILTKLGKLNDIEMELVRTHAETSYNILKEIDFPWPVAKIALQHHERING
ncbi:PAS domain S-box protein, partial [Candidatus Desantisbacteria bacterium]|nr:PAS domain S-box protein [Candidatus Desantisbacteria bacterium]